MRRDAPKYCAASGPRTLPVHPWPHRSRAPSLYPARCARRPYSRNRVGSHRGSLPCAGARGGRPELAGVFVAYVEGFARQVANGIVAPGRKTVFVRVFAPGIDGAGFGNHRSEGRVGDDVDPGRRRALSRRKRDHIFAAVLGESAEAVKEDQIGCARRAGGSGGAARVAESVGTVGS